MRCRTKTFICFWLNLNLFLCQQLHQQDLEELQDSRYISTSLTHETPGVPAATAFSTEVSGAVLLYQACGRHRINTVAVPPEGTSPNAHPGRGMGLDVC